MGGRARCSAWSWAFGLFFAWRCTTGYVPHPTPDHPLHACYVACPFGYSMRRQHLCRSDRRQFLDITITGEDDVAGDPSESRWFTGTSSMYADHEVAERLKAQGITPNDGMRWAESYGPMLKEVRAELGNDAMAAYNKQDVELCSCIDLQRRYDSQRDASQRGAAERGDSRPDHQ